MYHEPVLLHDCLNGLQIQPERCLCGCQHSEVVATPKPSSKNCRRKVAGLMAFDQDRDALHATCPMTRRLLFIHSNFRNLKNFLRLNGITEVDGILADLGVSSHQFDEASRRIFTSLRRTSRYENEPVKLTKNAARSSSILTTRKT